MQHRGSFMTKQQAQAKLTGQLYRIQRTVSSETELLCAILEFKTIANHIGYANSELLTATKKMMGKDPIWESIYFSLHDTLKSQA